MDGKFEVLVAVAGDFLGSDKSNGTQSMLVVGGRMVA